MLYGFSEALYTDNKTEHRVGLWGNLGRNGCTYEYISLVIMLPLNTRLDFIRSIHYTKAFSIAMISLVSGGTKGKESNVEFPL